MRPTLFHRAALTLAAVALMALPGLAQSRALHPEALHPEAGAMCRAECAQIAGNRHNAAQACAIRCAGTVAFLLRQNGGATPASLPTSRPQATRPLPAAARPAPSHSVIYGARAPSAAFGMVVGEPDRMAAHRIAERTCSAAGPGCRILAEFTATCAAAAHGVKRSQWALFMTSDPNSYVVTSLSAGSGPSQAVAEREAVAGCRSRDPLATCRVTASACAGRG